MFFHISLLFGWLEVERIQLKGAVTFMSAWACSGTTRFPAGSWEASSNAFALCGVFPSSSPRGSLAVPEQALAFKEENGPAVRIRSSDVILYGMFSIILVWQRWAWKLRDSRGLKSLGETPEAGLPDEEAHQLPTGKRVVSRPTLHSTKVNGNILRYEYSRLPILEQPLPFPLSFHRSFYV
ncbi:hypothetical protein N780_05365 [Pontibacillus chungwhensis BH030062]|uniref:Uncharacterized protein n=1 Tax=Pontibacillus chungwhensis BH030062 TaxID=1385513 RepID=A0A0A2UR64_9BACI|nr:hypothetical protein N780_05365 [Pontibacillus chungwhensis BH030062]